MTYLKSTFRYLKEHFLRMFAYCILPALVLGLVSSPVSLVKLLMRAQLDQTVSFSEIFLNGTDLNKPYKLGIMILAFLLYVFCAAVWEVFSIKCVTDISTSSIRTIFSNS